MRSLPSRFLQPWVAPDVLDFPDELSGPNSKASTSHKVHHTVTYSLQLPTEESEQSNIRYAVFFTSYYLTCWTDNILRPDSCYKHDRTWLGRRNKTQCQNSHQVWNPSRAIRRYQHPTATSISGMVQESHWSWPGLFPSCCGGSHARNCSSRVGCSGEFFSVRTRGSKKTSRLGWRVVVPVHSVVALSIQNEPSSIKGLHDMAIASILVYAPRAHPGLCGSRGMLRSGMWLLSSPENRRLTKIWRWALYKWMCMLPKGEASSLQTNNATERWTNGRCRGASSASTQN